MPRRTWGFLCAVNIPPDPVRLLHLFSREGVGRSLVRSLLLHIYGFPEGHNATRGKFLLEVAIMFAPWAGPENERTCGAERLYVPCEVIAEAYREQFLHGRYSNAQAVAITQPSDHHHVRPQRIPSPQGL